MVDTSVLDKLQQRDSATVCNVIELFEVRPRNRGFMTREIKAVFPHLPPMVGFACTATVRTFAQPPDRKVPTAPDFVSRFADLPGPPVAVLQNLDSGGSAALFGDVMCNSFKAFGAVGLVTDGPGRDYAGIKPLDFPVFCNGCVSSHGYNHMLELQTPVQIGGISVRAWRIAPWRCQRRHLDSAGDRGRCRRCLRRIHRGRAGHHRPQPERRRQPG